MTQNLRMTKGEIFSTADGEYSDYSVNGLFVAVEDFDMKEHAALHTAKRKGEYGQLSGFEAYLVSNQLAMPITYREIYVGSYSDFHDDFGVKKND